MEDNSAEDEDDEAALLRALAMSKDNEKKEYHFSSQLRTKKLPRKRQN